MIEADYLVVGAGAMGMAFTDVVVSETSASVVIVDRYGRPGGHWNHAYPHVRLHQPSAFYGVNSRPLGNDTKDAIGWNAGLWELASGSEVLAYFDQVMNQQFLASGRVRYFPMCDYASDGTFSSRVSGQTHEVKAKTIVDSTYMNVTVPSMRLPDYEVADGVWCEPPNALTAIGSRPHGYVVIGAGKTGIDACLWLLATGVDPSEIKWIMPRDSWLLDRATIQPGPEYFDSSVGGFADQVEAAALASSTTELFERLESSGQLLRLDKNVRPTMYRCATVTVAELEQLRRLEDVVRLGRVRSLDANKIVLDGGTVAVGSNVLHIDCTADGLERRPVAPVFDGDRITLQAVRTCQQVFSAAFISHVEASLTNESKKNELCSVIPHPDSDLDWLRTTRANIANMLAWGSEPEIDRWLSGARLNALRAGDAHTSPSPSQLAILGRIGQHMPGAITNLERLLAEEP